MIGESVKVILCGISYRVSRPEPWVAVFTQDVPFGGKVTRFMLHRGETPPSPLGGLWEFQAVDGWGDVPCHHINQAYEWCKANIGGDHDAMTKIHQTQREHEWGFDDQKSLTFCTNCFEVMDDSTRFTTCSPRGAFNGR